MATVLWRPIVTSVFRIVRFLATLCVWFDAWAIDGLAVDGLATLARVLSYPVRLLEWGLVQWYALVMVSGLLAGGVFCMWK
jgi:hypothetical protein